jgi:hypothetical protein
MLGVGVLTAIEVPQLFLARTLALFPIAAVAAGALAIVSIAAALQTPYPRLRTWIGKPRSRLFIGGVVVVKLALIVALYSGAGGDFVGGADFLWKPRTGAPLSWAHATLVAVVILAVVGASERHDLPEMGRGAAIGSIVIASILDEIAFALRGVPSERVQAAAKWIFDYSVQLQLVVLSLFAAVACFAWRRHGLTAGAALLLLAFLWLIPPLTGFLLQAAGREVPTFWATPMQVDTVLTCLVLPLAMWTTMFSGRIALRLLLLPALLIYSGILLPQDWEKAGKYVLVLAVLWLLAARLPPVAADPQRQTRVMSVLLGAQLATLAVYYLSFMALGLEQLSATSSLYGWLWLAVPLAAIFTARVRPG